MSSPRSGSIFERLFRSSETKQARHYVPTTKLDMRGAQLMFNLHRDVLRSVGEGITTVVFDFTNCKFLGQDMVAFLGGMIRLLEYRGVSADIDMKTMSVAVRKNLVLNGFLDEFKGTGRGSATKNTISYKQHRPSDESAIIEYLQSDWLGRGWFTASEDLTSAVVGKVWELYANAFEHSGSPIGVFSCGQHYPRVHQLRLSVVDFGSGIPARVRNFSKRPNISAASALRWAFQEGTTTSGAEFGRGLGLSLLRELVEVNGGSMHVYSNDGFGIIKGHAREEFGESPYAFDGTLFTITLMCKNILYVFRSESDRSSSSSEA